jgi:DNA modification methylase
MQNKLILGDNLEILKSLPPESVDLIYIDPPFFSNRNYKVIWGDGGEVRSFKDRWQGGIDHYIDWLYQRVEQMYRVLKKTGSMYLHCDWHADAYIRVYIMDKIFGMNNWMAECVWQYSWGVRTTKRWNRKHDTILVYTKSKDYTFNAEDVLEDRNLQEQSKKRLEYKGALIQDFNKRGKSEKALPADILNIPSMLHLPQDVLDVLTNTDADVWNIPTINAMSKERIGYPTQKPEALLERIIKASSNEGDVVLDCFVGGGTTIAVAERLNRKWIGIDQSVMAIKVSESRLNKQRGLFSAS